MNREKFIGKLRGEVGRYLSFNARIIAGEKAGGLTCNGKR